MKNKKKLYYIIGVVVCLLAVGFAALNMMPQGAPAQGGSGRRVQAQAVETVAASKGRINRVVKFSGEVTASSVVGVYSDVAGKVLEVLAETGSQVEAEQVLARIDPSRPGARFEPGSVRSPIAGTVVRSLVRPGDTVATNTRIMDIGILSVLELTASIPERYASAVAVGTLADVVLAAFPDQVFKARVVRVSPVFDPATRSKALTLRFLQRDRRIESGMFAELRMVAEERALALRVPVDALVLKGEDSFVYVVAEEKALLRPVKTGLVTDEFAEIVSGLREGESVVTKGQGRLTDGARVRVIAGPGAQAPSSAQPGGQRGGAPSESAAPGQPGGSPRPRRSPRATGG